LEAGVDITRARAGETPLLTTQNPQKLCARGCSREAEEFSCTSGISKQPRESVSRAVRMLPLSWREFGKEYAKYLFPKQVAPQGCLERCCRHSGSRKLRSPKAPGICHMAFP